METKTFFISDVLASVLNLDPNKSYLASHILYCFLSYLRQHKLYCKKINPNVFRINEAVALILDVEFQPNVEFELSTCRRMNQHLFSNEK